MKKRVTRYVGKISCLDDNLATVIIWENGDVKNQEIIAEMEFKTLLKAGVGLKIGECFSYVVHQKTGEEPIGPIKPLPKQKPTPRKIKALLKKIIKRLPPNFDEQPPFL